MTEPRVLLFDTSGRGGWVAVARGAEVLAVRPLDEARRHARDLAPAVAELLNGQGWRPRDVEALLVSRGPGSYTSLRVGLVSAKVFAHVTGCALVAVETFAAIAAGMPPEIDAADVVADAQQGKVYVQRFRRPAEPFTELTIEPFDEWLSRRTPGAWLCGPGLRVPGRRVPDGVAVAGQEFWDPRPEGMLRVGLERYQAGERDDPWSLEPIYLRPSSAEEKWNARV
jgi:tRNA threonylcarbamoyladenosine biosynthesis protein TsaB